jgi:hypothetical protein
MMDRYELKTNICTLFGCLQDTILHKGGNSGCSADVVWLQQNPLIW